MHAVSYQINYVSLRIFVYILR